ncbi:Nuclear pore complex protein Nup88, partial [Stegodyphus mimosarum]
MANAGNQRLSACGILDKLCLNSKKYLNIKESKNLLAIFEQNVFVWHDAGSCILTADINSEIKSSSYKMLTLTNPPVFDVESLLFNQTGSLLAISGKNGVMVFEVPWRYGKFGVNGENREVILGRSWNVAEYFFVCSNRISVVQTAWHPGSSSNTHLTVLSSDNYIRIYDVTDPQAPQQVISLGACSKSSYLSSESKITFSTCFGENTVSFDFGPPETMEVPQSNSTRLTKVYEEETIWPIFLLHGNGDVYILKAPMKKDRFNNLVAKLMGPLAMYPPTEDNYGYDACSILCLKTSPTCLVIATTVGILYHCLVLENDNYSNKVHQPDVTWEYEPPIKHDVALYVFESIELPLSLTGDQDDVYSHPIRLYEDITSHTKYHCSHVSGLHSVAMPFLQAVQETLDSGELEKFLTEQQKQASIVEHILCTKPFSQLDPVPVLGLDVTVSDAAVTMICLLASWEFVCLPLVSSYFSSTPQLLSENLASPKDEELSVISSFEQHLEKTLQRSLCSPFLKSFSTMNQIETSPQQWLDLLCSVTQRFREDYIQRLTTSQALLRSRVKVLTQQKEYQLRDISRLQQEKENLKNAAERLAEKYEDANANQQNLLKRIEAVLRKLQHHLPYLSKAEINMKYTLLDYEEHLKNFEVSLSQIKKKVKHQAEKMVEAGETKESISAKQNELKNVHFSETQMKHVKELLVQEGESITELVKTITALKKQA